MFSLLPVPDMGEGVEWPFEIPIRPSGGDFVAANPRSTARKAVALPFQNVPKRIDFSEKNGFSPLLTSRGVLNDTELSCHPKAA